MKPPYPLPEWVECSHYETKDGGNGWVLSLFNAKMAVEETSKMCMATLWLAAIERIALATVPPIGDIGLDQWRRIFNAPDGYGTKFNKFWSIHGRFFDLAEAYWREHKTNAPYPEYQ